MTEDFSRGGRKLDAALRLFGLQAEVRGARVVDVGASKGGFTEALLRHGARQVVAVDAGRDQLDARLRRDARVESLEGTDWKTLSLSRAPGPFDFFTVDVSFVAARNMLRGLAFRLRAGAHGVMLVKPQFELGERRLRAGKDPGGAVDDPELRRAALARVTEKARGLGFTLIAHADSPVAGGSGTVEVLAHLRFDGRPAALPQPGEHRGQPARAGRAAVGPPERWFLVSAPGLEQVTAREAAALSSTAGAGAAERIQAVDGGVEISGPLEFAYRANLCLRTATRVLARVGEVRAREFGKLRHAIAGLPWEGLIAPGAAVKVSATTTRCRLYHTGAIAETVELGIADRLARAPAAPGHAAADSPTVQTVLLRGLEDRFMVSVDSSGERLHRRGWRQESAAAPVRETLAAGLLALCDWDPSMALLDPMCGAGTIPIEAGMQALGIAPGIDRHFAFEGWPLHQGALRAAWEEMKARARAASEEKTRASAGVAAPELMIRGGDRSAPAVASALRNAERAGAAGAVRIERCELADARPFAERGLVLINPPYGRRLGDRRTLGRLYRGIGFVLRAHFSGWRAGVLVADQNLAQAIRIPPVAEFPLSNGGLRVSLLRFEIR
ncbi:MAG TPA: SAM-dependent methyltransferase [Polyangia bacterium]|nr:SAM-dependent methyltransferase [Polyangia bacterium]